MLNGITILKGTLQFVHDNGTIEEGFEHLIINLLKEYIDNLADVHTYAQTRRETGFESLNLIYRDQSPWKFYSHSDKMDIEMLLMLLEEYIQSHDDISDFEGMALEFNYSVIAFDTMIPTITDIVTSAIVVADDDGEALVEYYHKTHHVLKNYELSDLEDRTNLFVFDGHTKTGVSNLLNHLGNLPQGFLGDESFEGFKDENTKLVYEYMTREMMNNNPFGVRVRENDILGAMDILEGTMDEPFQIGSENLLNYMQEVSPKLLKEIMRIGEL